MRLVGARELQLVDQLVSKIGLGPGLTPEADDVLCGWLAIHRAAGVATPELDAKVLAALGRTTLLSATLLECAVHGEVIPEFAAYVAALGTPREAERAASLSRIGHTSGSALLRGARLALAHLTDEGTTGMLASLRFPRDPMSRHVELRSGAYADSVTLLQVSRDVQRIDGVVAAQVAMATPLNVDVLTQMGFDVPTDATPNDMVVAIRVADDTDLTAALAGVDTALAAAGRRSDDGPSELAPPRTTATALRRSEDALVLVSVPGPSAAVEAMDALDAGRDVMIFSDNVPLDQELALKRSARERGLLVMGPDCGTAVVGGLGLGFANSVTPGPVGIVAASGTGCQQLLCLLDHAGVGVTSALGVGGRDLSADVRGISTRTAMTRLDEDPAVELIVVVSKPPADEVAAEIRAHAETLDTPVEFALLGKGQPDLTAAAEAVLSRLGRDIPTWPVAGASALPDTGGSLLRGLFVGGTLCDEAMLIAADTLGAIRSNIPLQPELALGPDLTADAHLMIDFGDDALTAGRAHPMIDPTLRLEHLARVAADDRTGVILMDVVLGHGAEPDPASALADALQQVRQPVVFSVVGTELDPQGLTKQVATLAAAGAEVHRSNANATRRAIQLIGGQR